VSRRDLAEVDRRSQSVDHMHRGPDDLALLGSLREELRWLVLKRFTTALRAAQVDSLMLGDVFDMLEGLAAFRATVSVRRHVASPH